MQGAAYGSQTTKRGKCVMANMEALRQSIQPIIQEEISRAKQNHKDYTTIHQAYSLMKEEIEETQDELVKVKSLHDSLWEDIKRDEYNSENQIVWAKAIKNVCDNVIAEAVHIATVTSRTIEMLEKGEQL